MGAMHVVTMTRRVGEREYSTTLLRRSFRQDGRVRKETLANLPHLPVEAIDAIRRTLRGEVLIGAEAAFDVERSLPAGHVQAALVMARRLELARLLDRAPCRERDLCLAMICQRAIAPASKLGTVRALQQSTLGSELGVHAVDEDDLYAAMDWLGERSHGSRTASRVVTQRRLAGPLRRVLELFRGHSCPLAKIGYSRDGKRNTPQIIYGLLCDKPGRPIAVEVFSGELHDDLLVHAGPRTTWAGRWILPGGGADHGEDLAATVTRELVEETGLNVAVDSIRTVTSDVVDSVPRQQHLWTGAVRLRRHRRRWNSAAGDRRQQRRRQVIRPGRARSNAAGPVCRRRARLRRALTGTRFPAWDVRRSMNAAQFTQEAGTKGECTSATSSVLS